MPKRSDDYMAERRRQILDAAIGCIVRQGWNSTTVDDVATAAGLSKGAVYIHFTSKQALLMGLLERNVEEIEARVAIDTLDLLRADLLDGLGVLAGPDGWRIATGQLEAQVEGIRDPEIRAVLTAATDRMVAIFTGIVRRIRPDLPAAEARLRALTLIILLDGLRSFRSISDAVGEADMRAVLERQLAELTL